MRNDAVGYLARTGALGRRPPSFWGFCGWLPPSFWGLVWAAAAELLEPVWASASRWSASGRLWEPLGSRSAAGKGPPGQGPKTTFL